MAASRYLPLLMTLLCAVQTGVCCLPVAPGPTPEPTPPPDPWADVQATPEVEPNNSLATATPVTFDATGRARLAGEIPSPALRREFDADYYNLGPFTAGDRLTLEVVTPGSDLKAVAAVFDADGRLFELRSAETTDAGIVDPRIDEIIHHDSTAYYLVLSRMPRAGLVGGAYEVHVVVQRGGAAPVPQPQLVWLNFGGGTVVIPEQGPIALGAFDPADIDPVYAGQNAVVRDRILRTVRQNYARYAVTVLSSDEGVPPAGERFSTVYFGGFDPRSLGEALAGTDFYNANPSDNAVIFTQRFTEDLFTVRPDALGLGTAIGNVASHEIGHLVGLSHVHQPYDLMNGYDAPDNLLGDQRFKYSLLSLSIFQVVDIRLGQDGHRMLLETLGPAPSASDVELPVCADPAALAIGDLDEDGSPDVVAACPTTLELRVLWNDRHGAFPDYTKSSGFGTTSVGIVDLDGNGHPDLFGTNVGTDKVFVYLNKGKADFAAPQTYPGGPRPWTIAAGDVTGDGFPDLAVTNSFADNVSVLPNQGDGTFTANATVLAAAFPNAIAVADLNGDHQSDLAFSYYDNQTNLSGLQVLLNNGAGGFLPAAIYAELSLVTGVVAADVNGDGWPDLVVADRYRMNLASGSAIVLLNDGAGGFASPAYYMAGDGSDSLALGDLNGDNSPDIVVANSGTNDVSVLIGRGDGTFEPEQPYRVGGSPAAVAIADLNGDGLPDIVAANPDSGTLSILFNKGGGKFGASAAAP